MRFLYPTIWSRRRFDSSSIITHSVNFDTVGEIVKMWYQELDIYLYMHVGITLSIIDILVQPEISPLFRVFLLILKKNMFFKIWQFCDWLAKWLFVLGYGSKAAEACSAFQRRSCYILLWILLMLCQQHWFKWWSGARQAIGHLSTSALFFA